MLLFVRDGKNLLEELVEAAANGCAVIITNKGGLPETVTDAKILNKLNVSELTKNLKIINK